MSFAQDISHNFFFLLIGARVVVKCHTVICSGNHFLCIFSYGSHISKQYVHYTVLRIFIHYYPRVVLNISSFGFVVEYISFHFSPSWTLHPWIFVLITASAVTDIIPHGMMFHFRSWVWIRIWWHWHHSMPSKHWYCWSSVCTVNKDVISPNILLHFWRLTVNIATFGNYKVNLDEVCSHDNRLDERLQIIIITLKMNNSLHVMYISHLNYLCC